MNSEAEFESYVRTLIAEHVTAENKCIYALDNKKAVDIVICDDINPTLYFIEIKFHKKSHGRLGFGGSKGSGYQPEILLKNPAYFSTNMRWIIGEENSEKFYFLTNAEIIQYVSGGEIGQKFNNIQKRVFKEKRGLTESQLVDALKKWLL